MITIVQNADGRRVELQAGGYDEVGADPRDCNRAEDVAVRKGNRSADTATRHEIDELPSARGDLIGTLAAG